MPTPFHHRVRFSGLRALTSGLVGLLAIGLLAAVPAFSQDDIQALQKAGSLFSQGKYNQAAKIYRNVIKESPSNRYAYLGLGLSLKATGNLHEAQEVMDKLIAIDPTFAPAYYNLGLILEDKGDMAGARRAYQKFVEHSHGQIPEDPEIRIKLRKMGLI